MRLGIDLDGVVADFNAGWITRYNTDFGTAIPLDAVSRRENRSGITLNVDDRRTAVERLADNHAHRSGMIFIGNPADDWRSCGGYVGAAVVGRNGSARGH